MLELLKNKTKALKEGLKDLFTSAKDGNPIAGTVLIVVGSVALFIGLFVVGEVDNAIKRGGESGGAVWTAAMNSSYEGIRTNAFSAFTLMGVSLIVIGAGFIIGYLRGGAFSGGRM